MATGNISEGEYVNLQQTVAVLEQRVDALEDRLDAKGDRSAPIPDVTGLRDEVVRVTQELFPGQVAITVTDDPDYPRDSYTVVYAQASGEIKEIEDRREQWHQRVAQLSSALKLLRLSLDYQS